MEAEIISSLYVPLFTPPYSAPHFLHCQVTLTMLLNQQLLPMYLLGRVCADDSAACICFQII